MTIIITIIIIIIIIILITLTIVIAISITFRTCFKRICVFIFFFARTCEFCNSFFYSFFFPTISRPRMWFQYQNPNPWWCPNFERFGLFFYLNVRISPKFFFPDYFTPQDMISGSKTRINAFSCFLFFFFPNTRIILLFFFLFSTISQPRDVISWSKTQFQVPKFKRFGRKCCIFLARRSEFRPSFFVFDYFTASRHDFRTQNPNRRQFPKF